MTSAVVAQKKKAHEEQTETTITKLRAYKILLYIYPVRW